jgi:4-amino-4-deoxy-L-arabinose transferase-like glycosyltransferase
LLIGKWFGEKPWYRKRIVIPLSVIVAVIAVIALFFFVYKSAQSQESTRLILETEDDSAIALHFETEELYLPLPRFNGDAAPPAYKKLQLELLSEDFDGPVTGRGWSFDLKPEDFDFNTPPYIGFSLQFEYRF